MILKPDSSGPVSFSYPGIDSTGVRQDGLAGGNIIPEFEARIQNQGDPASGLPIHIQIENQRMRIWAGPSRLGSWPLEEVSVERPTPFRFRVMVDGDPMIVTPDDPTGFATTTGAIVDVRPARFGLADRIWTSREA